MENEQFFNFLLRVHAIAKIGLKYSTDPYAIDNYTELNKLSKEMLENFTNVKFDRPNYFPKDVYPTPNVSVRTIVGKGNKILLVKEANSGTWSFPGGWADLNEKPTDAAKLEVLQEAGINCEITRLIGVLNRQIDKNDICASEYTVVFEATTNEYDYSKHCFETTEVAYFDVDNLPTMSKKLRKDMIERIIEAYKNKTVIFD